MRRDSPRCESQRERLAGLQGVLDGVDGEEATGAVEADGVKAQLAGTALTNLLGDALGSVRGSGDDTETPTGSTDYGVSGAVGGTSTIGSFVGFTDKQLDGETGLYHLRARVAARPAVVRSRI